MKTKTVLINLVILVCVALLGYSLTLYFNGQKPDIIVQPEAPAEKMADKDTVPDYSFVAMDGEEYSLQQFRGKIVLLNFWASWCAPCIKEFPHLIEIANNHPDDLVFIGLSSDVAEKTMLAFVEKFENKMDAKLDTDNIIIALDRDEATHRLFRTYRLPETLIIDQDGVMREKLIGADWTVEYVEKQIEEINSEQ